MKMTSLIPLSKVFAFSAALGASLFCHHGSAQIPLPIYEPFPLSYTNTTTDDVQVPQGGATYRGIRLGNGATANVWAIGNSDGGGSAQVVGGPAALSYPGLYQVPSSLGMYARTNNTTANRNRGILFPPVDNGTVYLSFLINVEQYPDPLAVQTPYNRLLLKLDNYSNPALNNSSGTSLMAGFWLTTNHTFAISKSSNAQYTMETAPIPSGTHLVVLRYKFNPDVDDDEVALWVDPGSLGLGEGSVPTPTLTLTAGGDVPSLASMLYYAQGSEVVMSAFIDEVRIGRTWLDATPTQAPCNPPVFSQSPADRTVSEGVSAIMSIVAGGSSPTYQWQVSSDSGSTWQNVTDGIGATALTYWTRPLSVADSGNRYRAVATVSCSGATATSEVAVVTVQAATPTPNGVVVNDSFQDFWYNNLPYAVDNSVWFTSSAGLLDASAGVGLIGTAPASGSVTWIGFFTDDLAGPVHLAVGKALKGTLQFKASNIIAQDGGLRMGFFDYADGGMRPTADGFGSAMGGTVRGYMASINYGQTFTGNPLSLYARNNLGNTDLMGTTGSFASLGGGPGGYAGAPAFQNDVLYTLEFTIARKSLSSVEVTASISGGGTNWTHTRVDNTYAYPRFDSFAVRVNNSAVGNPWTFPKFAVEVINSAPGAIPLTIARQADSVVLNWSDPAFTLQSSTALDGTFTDVVTGVTTYTAPAIGGRKFYRLIWKP